MSREVAVFINKPAAIRAGQAAVQEIGGAYYLHTRTRRGAVVGYAVELRPAGMREDAQRIYIMEQ